MPKLQTALAAVLLTALAAPGASPTEEGPLLRLVDFAFATGFGGPLSGRICTALGVTRNRKPLPVEQLSVSASGIGRTFNVSRHRGRLDVIVALKTKESTTVFLTSANGDLQKAIQSASARPEELREIPGAEAVPVFEKEKAWWLEWLSVHGAAKGRG